MFDLVAYLFKYLNTEKIKPEYCFTGAYVEEVYESEHVRTANKILRLILDVKYRNSDLHKVMGAQCQHLTMIQRNILLKLLQKLPLQ